MQFQVPQFIETEDKVVGPFSLRQFLYVGVAAVASAMCYFVLQTWLFAIFATIFMSAAIAISFVKIQGRPLLNVLVAATSFYWKPQIYIWKSEPTHVARRKQEDSGVPIEAVATEMALKKPTLANILSESPLHKSWEELQTGAPLAQKTSDKQFLEGKMNERYQIFQKIGGDRNAARRVDYR